MLNQVAGNKGGKHKWAIKEEWEQKGREAESLLPAVMTKCYSNEG